MTIETNRSTLLLMYCSKCGTKVDGSKNFCPSCGKSLKKSSSTGSPGIKKTFRLKLIPVIILAVATIFFGAYYIKSRIFISKFPSGADMIEFNKQTQKKEQQAKFAFSSLVNVENLHLEEAKKLAMVWSKNSLLCGFSIGLEAGKDSPSVTYSFCDPNKKNGYHVSWYYFSPDKPSTAEREWTMAQKIALPTLVPPVTAKKAAETTFETLQGDPAMTQEITIKSIDSSITVDLDYWHSLVYLLNPSTNKGTYVSCDIYFDSSKPPICK